MSKKNFDDIYKTSITKISDFVFDKKVASVFQNMINRSVPHYSFIVNMTGEISKEFITNGSNCYDLGSALGASSMSVWQNNQNKKFKIIAVDNSEAMIEKSKNMIKNTPIEFILSDINYVDFKNASFVISNFTLQFLDIEKRFELIKKIYDGMNHGGALFVSEKIKFKNNLEEKFENEMHYAFKKLNGYTDFEINQKRTALENVLLKETFFKHKLRLKQIGFKKIYQWFQCFNFVSFVSIK